MNKKIKWGCIQPLTGGMYIGARGAIGHDAEWIISYEGLDSVKYDALGNMSLVGNEYNLLKWFEKNNISVPYYKFQHKMFERISPEDVVLKSDDVPFDASIYDDMDIVVAVPVCSGLSQATIAANDTKSERNCNMEFITEYTLSTIKPKIYIFENAPGLVGTKGDHERELLNEIAMNYGYSVVYFKTDTMYHHNCQKRPRTFIMFMKWNNNEGLSEAPFDVNTYHYRVAIEDYLNLIPEDASQQNVTCSMSAINRGMLAFFIEKFGDDWREKLGTKHYLTYMLEHKLTDEFIEFVNRPLYFTDEEIEKIEHYINHVLHKISLGLNYYSTTIWGYDDTIPAIMFKTIQSVVHHSENRLLNIRECLWLMGMPHDFELYGLVDKNAAKIGQNVPVNTAKYIVSEAVRIITEWDTLPARETNVDNFKIVDNTKNPSK